MDSKIVLTTGLAAVFVILLAVTFTQITGYASLAGSQGSQAMTIAEAGASKGALYVPTFSILTYLLFFALVIVFILLFVSIKKRKQ